MDYLEPLISHIKALKEKNVTLVDLQPDMAIMKVKQQERFYSLFNLSDPRRHMNQRGNQFVAEKLDEAINNID